MQKLTGGAILFGGASRLSFSAKSLGSFLLVITPAISLVSANLHFQIIAGAAELFPARMFTLQDHFDKAVDLLIPVFLMYVLAACIGAAHTELSGDSSESELPELTPEELAVFIKKEKRKEFRSNIRIATFTAIWMLITVGPLKWLGLFGIFLVVSVPLNRLLTKIAGKVFNWDYDATFMRVAFATSIVAAIVVGIVITAKSGLIHANQKYWDTREEVIIDKFGPNYFIIRDARYYLIDGEGAPIFIGNKIPERAESISCAYIGGRACWNSHDLTGDDDKE